jgi:imidazolonepropionase-like amidohydrolase
MKKILFPLIFLTAISSNAQTKSVLLMNGTAHLGTDSVIQNSLIGIKDGKLILVADATITKIDNSTYDEVLNVSGKQVYPGFIIPNTNIGLTEIEAVRATNDFKEVGTLLPNVRALIAYNTDSKIIPTTRSNGILLAQITPRGGTISGTSSIVKLNGWNWEDAAYKIDDGIHVNWPRIQTRTYLDEDNIYLGANEKNKEYDLQTTELEKLFTEAKAYNETISNEEKNLRFEALKGVFNGSKTVYIHSDGAKEMIEAIAFFKKYSIKKIVIVGGNESWMITDLLRENNIPVIVSRLHELPDNAEDDVDLPYKLPYLLQKAGILFCLNNEGDMEASRSRNLPFLAGTAATYGLTKEQALQSITLNTAKILGIDKTTGSIEVGKDATIFISSGDALDMRSNNVEKAYIQGLNIDLNNHQKILYETYKKKYGLN